jgi:hypothetical protein
VGVINTGSVRLTDVQLQGPENNCTTIPVLWPGDNITTCTVHKAVNQAAFDAREANETPATLLSVEVGVVATPNVTTTLTVNPLTAVFDQLALTISRSLSATSTLNTTTVDTAGAGMGPSLYDCLQQHKNISMQT